MLWICRSFRGCFTSRQYENNVRCFDQTEPERSFNSRKGCMGSLESTLIPLIHLFPFFFFFCPAAPGTWTENVTRDDKVIMKTMRVRLRGCFSFPSRMIQTSTRSSLSAFTYFFFFFKHTFETRMKKKKMTVKTFWKAILCLVGGKTSEGLADGS